MHYHCAHINSEQKLGLCGCFISLYDSELYTECFTTCAIVAPKQCYYVHICVFQLQPGAVPVGELVVC